LNWQRHFQNRAFIIFKCKIAPHLAALFFYELFHPDRHILFLGDVMDYLVIALIFIYGILIAKARRIVKEGSGFFLNKGKRMVARELETLARQDSRFKVYNRKAVKRYRIDHLVVLNDKVFVIRTENCKGEITGDIHSTYWIGNGNKRFKNPVAQNADLCRIMSRKFNRPAVNIVVFTGDSSPPHLPGVVKLDSLTGYIKCQALRFTA